jgi:transcription antitermination factor NusG
MDSWAETNWFAVQTKPFQERLAAAHVAELDAEVFLPKVRQDQMICGFIRRVTKPLFPGYLFAMFCPLQLLDPVRYAPGVLRVVGNSCLPIPVNHEVVSAIRDRVQADGFIRLEQQPLRPGDKVAIEQGPFAGWMGEVERELDDGRRVSILLEAIQQARVLIEKRWLAATPVVA